MTRTARTRIALLFVAVCATVLGGLPPAAASAGDRWTLTETKSYTMGDVGPLLGGPRLMQVAVGCYEGSVCFPHTYGDSFSVRIEDDSGRRVGGVLRIENEWGTVMTRPFCGSTGRIRNVGGFMRVFLDAPGDVRGAHWYGGPGCAEMRALWFDPLGGTAGRTTRGATSGRVHVTFSGRR